MSIVINGTASSMVVNGTSLSEAELTSLDGATGNIQTGKQDTLVSGSNIKTINGTSVLGSGNMTVIDSSFTANDTRIMTALNAGGTAPIFACRAWANFNAVGTVTTRASGNVSTVADGGIGDFTVNFIVGLVDGNYEISGIAGSATDPNNGNVVPAGLAPTNFRIFTGSPSDATKRDYSYNTISVHR